MERKIWSEEGERERRKLDLLRDSGREGEGDHKGTNINSRGCAEELKLGESIATWIRTSNSKKK